MKPGIEDQLALEDQMLSLGAQRYMARQKRAEQNARGAETDYARRLIKEYVGLISAGITSFLEATGPGRKGKARGLLVDIEPDKAAYFALRGVFNAFPRKNQAVQTISIGIGRTVEDEIRFTRFQEKYKEYYDALIADFKRKGTKNYQHKHRVLTFKANKLEDGWKSWTDEERMMLGAKLIDIMRDTTELVDVRQMPSQKNKQGKMTLVPTEKAAQWIAGFLDHAAMLDPSRAPCIIEPDPWTGVDQGGYYSPKLRANTPFVLNMGKRHERLLRKADLTPVFSAVNAIQQTPWRVNSDILDTMQAAWQNNLGIGMPSSEPLVIPPSPLTPEQNPKELSPELEAKFKDWKQEATVIYTAERERVSKCFQAAQSIRTAQEYRGYEQIWFVHQCDFRARTYAASSGLSPQGTDPAKALLRFATPKLLGVRGMYWLKVHAANVYGFDKAPYADRVKFIEERLEAVRAVAGDPLSHREFWANADKPWQFLAACRELSAALARGPSFASSLPVALDGSCNGLQHFSAMLLDPIGGAATNLRPGATPADIYGEVARVCTARLRSHADPLAAQWVAFCDKHGNGYLPRAVAKRPVMTLPYGSTKRSCMDHIFSCIREIDKGFFPGSDFDASRFLTDVLWDSIGEVVVSARQAMSYIQDVAGKMTDADKPLVWTTPTGFPVYQGTMEIKTRQIETQLCGRLQMRLQSQTNVLWKAKQKQGASPNFVHSQDASHMHMTVNRAIERGVTAFAMIHDDFGTHAADIDILHEAIRETFVEMYSGEPTLEKFRDGLGVAKLPKAPGQGSLDINEVLRAEFFFG